MTMRRLMAQRRARRERGAAAVEFALILPIFLMLLFGIIDFGFAINRASVVGNAARDGARVGAFSNSTQAEAEAAARASLDGIPDATVVVQCLASDGSACSFDAKPNGAAARVTVEYKHKMFTPVGIFVPGGLELSRTSEMRFESR